MGIFARIFGICATKPPQDPGCWSFGDGRLEIDLAQAPELAENGGAVRLEGKGLPARALVLKGEDGKFHAFVNKCTHGGRRLDPTDGGARVQCCSVGKSTFDLEGNRLSGSAKGPVSALAASVENGTLVITF